MASRFSKFASSLAVAATLSMTATPAFANHRWGGWGRHHNDVDAGDVIAGVAILGGIIAIASAASKSNRDRRARGSYPDRDYRDYRSERDDSYRYRDRDEGYGSRYSSSSRGIDGAVDSCVGEVERGSNRVDTVDSVDREADGWRVEGRTNGGRPFSCSVTGSGRIRSVTVDGRAAAYDGDQGPAAGEASEDDSLSS